MIFTQEQESSIAECWGREYILKFSQGLELYAEKWRLSDFEFVEYYSINAIFFCRSEKYGGCVLKMGGGEQDYEFEAEYSVLREYNGRRYVKAYEADIDISAGRKAMLIERAVPGDRLTPEPFEKRLAVFAGLYNGLHVAPENPGIYKSYAGLVCEGADDCEKSREDLKGIGAHMQAAKKMCLELCVQYNKNMLLHIDLYGDNIISGGSGGYRIIDPKGLVGDPIFETGQYIFAECCEDKIEPEKLGALLDYFEKSLCIPQDILRKCFYIEAVRFISYYASRYGADDWDAERVAFAYASGGELF